MIDLNKIDYNTLNARQKENYNYHKVASALADYGYDCMRLNNDWEGADFIAVKDEQMLKVQLKSRFTLSKKYLRKDIYIAFREEDDIYIFDHDKAVNYWGERLNSRRVWVEDGLWHQKPIPKQFIDLVIKL